MVRKSHGQVASRCKYPRSLRHLPSHLCFCLNSKVRARIVSIFCKCLHPWWDPSYRRSKCRDWTALTQDEWVHQLILKHEERVILQARGKREKPLFCSQESTPLVWSTPVVNVPKQPNIQLVVLIKLQKQHNKHHGFQEVLPGSS